MTLVISDFVMSPGQDAHRVCANSQNGYLMVRSVRSFQILDHFSFPLRVSVIRWINATRDPSDYQSVRKTETDGRRELIPAREVVLDGTAELDVSISRLTQVILHSGTSSVCVPGCAPSLGVFDAQLLAVVPADRAACHPGEGRSGGNPDERQSGASAWSERGSIRQWFGVRFRLRLAACVPTLRTARASGRGGRYS